MVMSGLLRFCGPFWSPDVKMELCIAPIYYLTELLPLEIVLRAAERLSQVLHDKAIRKQFLLREGFLGNQRRQLSQGSLKLRPAMSKC